MEDNAGEKQGRVVTVGTFDGVHTGHVEVLETLKAFGRERGLRPSVVTFDRHPLETVCPGRAPLPLQSIRERDDMLRSHGVEVIRVAFTPEVSRLDALTWMRHLKEEYGAEALLTGYDNRFGSDCRSLTTDDYIRLGGETGIEVRRAREIPGVCSSEVRRALAAGETDRAAAMLGRLYSITGTVETGRQLGRNLGFPTANITIPAGRQLPAPGVYAAIAEGRPAVVNIGHNPTVAEGNPMTVEVHILGWEGDLYGRQLTVEFVKRLRAEEKFPDLEALKSRIAADAEAASRLLGPGFTKSGKP